MTSKPIWDELSNELMLIVKKAKKHLIASMDIEDYFYLSNIIHPHEILRLQEKVSIEVRRAK